MTDILKYYPTCRLDPDAGDRGADHYVRYNVVWDIIKKRSLPAQAQILDAGCGYGHASIALYRRHQESNWLWHALDIHEENINYAKAYCSENALPIGFQKGDLAQIPFPSGSMDVIICLEVLSCSTQPDAIVNELRRVLKKGGVMILSSPNGDRFKPNDAKRSGYPEGCRFFTVDDFLRFGQGLRVLDLYGQESYYYQWPRRMFRKIWNHARPAGRAVPYQEPHQVFLHDFPVTGRDPKKGHTLIAVYEKEN